MQDIRVVIIRCLSCLSSFFAKETEENRISLLSLTRNVTKKTLIVIGNCQYETSTFAIALVSKDVETSSFSYFHISRETLP